jgi:hypothetical protein
VTLTTAQYGVLNKIARRTKMDCWFLIKQDPSGDDYVYDIENGINVTLNEGLYLLMEGLDCKENIEACELNWIEKTVLSSLCLELDVPVPEYIK